MNELDIFEGSDQPLFELALFAGAGGGILGGKLLSWQTVAAVEWEAYPGAVLSARQDDELLAPFPIWSDVQSFTKRNNACRRFIRSLRAIRHQLVISGGFPCQDISAAGKGEGIDGARSGMWGHMARIIGEIRPEFVFVENSPMLVGRGLARVLSDLAQMGYDASWCIVGAADCGAPHKRDRIWIKATDTRSEQLREQSVTKRRGPGATQPKLNGLQRSVADTNGERELQSQGAECSEWRRVSNCRETLANADSERLIAGGFRGRHETQLPEADDDCGSCRQGAASDSLCIRCRQMEFQDSGGKAGPGISSSSWQRSFDRRGESWWTTEPDVGRVAHGVAARVDRLKALGNGQVPFAAATAWRILTERSDLNK